MASRRLLIVLPLLLGLLLLIPVAASAQTTAFVDTRGSSHEQAVSALVDEGIVEGCQPDRFCPRDVLTRGQLSSLLVRTLGLPPADGGQFSDTAGTSHADAIDALADAGLVLGCEDGRFCPNDPITRAQLATMVHRAFDLTGAPANVRYFDDINGGHEPAVRAIAAAGITAGCSDGLTSFCPDDGLQRAHAAVFLARTLELVDRVEMAPFDERRAAQDEIDATAQAARLAADQERERQAAEAAKAAAETPAQVAVKVALAQVGKPYRWGANGPNSFDCSGLTSFAWAQAGVTIPRTSRTQYSGMTRISRSELRPGDLVFYYSPVSHVAMYIGDGKVVEAPNSSNNVRIRNDGLTRRGVVGYARP